MKIQIESEIMNRIQIIGEAAYPEEAAGFIFGLDLNGQRIAKEICEVRNSKENGKRHNRYLITPKDFFQGEIAAEEKGLEVIGVFHSHPDHPDQPSEFDKERAMPWFSYVITSVEKGIAISSRSWRLLDDRSRFQEEKITSVQEKLEK